MSLSSPKALQIKGSPLVSLDASVQACQAQGPPMVSLAKTQDEHIPGLKLIKPNVHP